MQSYVFRLIFEFAFKSYIKAHAAIGKVNVYVPYGRVGGVVV